MSDEIGFGTIKCFFSLKGYGFITREKGKDLFFFYRDLRDEGTIFDGVKVRFKVDKNEDGKGPRAIEIERVG